MMKKLSLLRSKLTSSTLQNSILFQEEESDNLVLSSLWIQQHWAPVTNVRSFCPPRLGGGSSEMGPFNFQLKYDRNGNTGSQSCANPELYCGGLAFWHSPHVKHYFRMIRRTKVSLDRSISSRRKIMMIRAEIIWTRTWNPPHILRKK